MSIEWFLYLANFIDNINDGLNIIFWLTLLILGSVWLIKGLSFIAEGGDSFFPKLSENSNKIFKKLLIPIFIILMFLPSGKTLYLIAGANLAKQSYIPSKVELVIEKKLDEYLKEDSK